MVHTKDWVEVPAQVQEWNVQVSSTPGRTGTTRLARLVGAYSYEWKGTKYTSTTLSPLAGASRHLIVQALRSDHPTAYVNPLAPTQSTLTRVFPWEHMLFTAVFLIFPCGFVSFAALAMKKQGCFAPSGWRGLYPGTQ